MSCKAFQDSEHRPENSITDDLDCMADDTKHYLDTCEAVCLDGFQGHQAGHDIDDSRLTYRCSAPNSTDPEHPHHGVWRPANGGAPLICGDVSASNAAPVDAGEDTETAIVVVLGLMAVAGLGVWWETGRRKKKAASKRELELSMLGNSRRPRSEQPP